MNNKKYTPEELKKDLREYVNKSAMRLGARLKMAWQKQHIRKNVNTEKVNV